VVRRAKTNQNNSDILLVIHIYRIMGKSHMPVCLMLTFNKIVLVCNWNL